jgi:Fur family transcriptional regulator, ferric uptake regulator
VLQTKKELFDWAVQACHEHKIKRTRPLESVLHYLAHHDTPTSWSDLSSDREIKAACNAATVFRIAMKLERAGILRRVGLHSRHRYYVLSAPGRHCDYLICRNCGAIVDAPGSCPIHQIEEEVERELGFHAHFHELEIYGECRDCQRKKSKQPRILNHR